MELPVQRQLRDQDVVLTRMIENRSTARLELAEAYGELGNLLMAAESLDVAEACYRNAEALAPNDPRWPYYLGHLYRIRGDASNARAAFERALQLAPNDVATLVWLGNLYLDRDRVPAAASLFTKALSLEPGSVAALAGLGRAELAAANYAQAAAHFEQALAGDPRATIIHYPLALAYRGLGDRDRAEAHLRQRGQVDVTPTDPLMQRLGTLLQSGVAYESRGVRALNRGEWVEAAIDFRKGLELAPDRASLHHELGTALAMGGDPPAGFREFQRAVQLSPTFAKAHYSLGVMMASSPRGQRQAMEELAAAVRYDPSYVEARVQLANVLRRSGRARDALSEYEEAIARDPRLEEAQVGAARSLARLNRYEEARDRLIEAAAAHPDRIGITQGLVRMLAAAPDDRVRDGRRAAALAKALETVASGLGAETHVQIAEAAAMAHAEVGEYDEAARWQRDAITVAARAGRGDLAMKMAETLALYEHHKPCRTPWRDDE
jgi:tetratricopeptide (TPR) repeat protein